jgi:hypothetical protein
MVESGVRSAKGALAGARRETRALRLTRVHQCGLLSRSGGKSQVKGTLMVEAPPVHLLDLLVVARVERGQTATPTQRLRMA